MANTILNRFIDFSNIKAFIFDLDGTLIDTEKIYRIVWPKAMKELGLEMDDERFLSCRSLGKPFATERFKKWYGEDFDLEGARAVRKRYFDEYIAEHGISVKPGAFELLGVLKEKGYVTAISTATDMNRATQYLQMTGLTGHFDRIVSATMVDEGKPSPKVYEYACSQLGFKPSECVAVEDAPNGITSASRGGLKVIMVPDLTEPDDELMKMIDYKASSLSDIIAHLQ